MVDSIGGGSKLYIRKEYFLFLAKSDTITVKQDLTKSAEKLQEVSELGKTRHPWGISQIFNQFSVLPQQGALPAELQVEQVERKECQDIVP